MNGTPKDHAGTFLGGALVSLVLPVAGIAYFIFLRYFSTTVLSEGFEDAVAGGEVEAVPLSGVIDAVAGGEL